MLSSRREADSEGHTGFEERTYCRRARPSGQRDEVIGARCGSLAFIPDATSGSR